MTGDTADIIKFQVLNESLSHKCDTRSGFQIDEFLLIAGLTSEVFPFLAFDLSWSESISRKIKMDNWIRGRNMTLGKFGLFQDLQYLNLDFIVYF